MVDTEGEYYIPTFRLQTSWFCVYVFVLVFTFHCVPAELSDDPPSFDYLSPYAACLLFRPVWWCAYIMSRSFAFCSFQSRIWNSCTFCFVQNPDMVPRFLDQDKFQLRSTFPINITFALTRFSSSFIKIIPRFHFHLVDATSIGHSRSGASFSKSHSGITK